MHLQSAFVLGRLNGTGSSFPYRILIVYWPRSFSQIDCPYERKLAYAEQSLMFRTTPSASLDRFGTCHSQQESPKSYIY